MNKLTRQIKMKGYKIEEFLKIINISLSSYRKYEVENHPEHDWLCNQIDNAPQKIIKNTMSCNPITKTATLSGDLED